MHSFHKKEKKREKEQEKEKKEKKEKNETKKTQDDVEDEEEDEEDDDEADDSTKEDSVALKQENEEIEEIEKKRQQLRKMVANDRSQSSLFLLPPLNLVNDDKFILQMLRSRKFDVKRTTKNILDYWNYRSDILKVTDRKITKKHLKEKYVKEGYVMIPNIRDKKVCYVYFLYPFSLLF